MWIAKALLQKVLAGIPGGMQLNYRLQNIKAGNWMKAADARAPGLMEFISKVDKVYPVKDAIVFESGTGWTAINALLLSLMGAKQIIATDHIAHLRTDLLRSTLEGLGANSALIAQYANRTEEEVAAEVKWILGGVDMNDMLTRARIEYRAPFDASHSLLADKSIDIHFSYAVLAHVPEEHLAGFAQETARLVKPGGIAAHTIGLQDPFNGINGGRPLNFLRYSERVWSFLSHNSIQYNNRVRAPQYIEKFEKSGATTVEKWPTVKDRDLEYVRNNRIDLKYSNLSDDDLATIKLEVIFRYA